MKLNLLDQPSTAEVRSFNPYAHILSGQYRTPSYFIHGRSDTFVPWQQAQIAYDALQEHEVPCGLSLLENEGHLFDIDSHDPKGRKWEAIEQAYQFLHNFLFSDS
jgi:acetyl esterase/lipase